LIGRIGHALRLRRQRRQLRRAFREMRAHFGAQQIDERLPGLRHESVQIDERRDALGHPVGDAGDHHAAVAVPDEYQLVQSLGADGAEHVGNVRGEIDRW